MFRPHEMPLARERLKIAPRQHGIPGKQQQAPIRAPRDDRDAAEVAVGGLEVRTRESLQRGVVTIGVDAQ